MAGCGVLVFVARDEATSLDLSHEVLEVECAKMATLLLRTGLQWFRHSTAVQSYAMMLAQFEPSQWAVSRIASSSTKRLAAHKLEPLSLLHRSSLPSYCVLSFPSIRPDIFILAVCCLAYLLHHDAYSKTTATGSWSASHTTTQPEQQYACTRFHWLFINALTNDIAFTSRGRSLSPWHSSLA